MRTSFSVTQDCILGNSQPSLRDLIMLLTCTQDYVLGYSQPSLRDSTVGVERRRSGPKALIGRCPVWHG
jgi:hypothetical protein